ncbi:MAG TPA: uracil-DNA glycosylase [Beijerinckiaceae bacterium]|jgi:DNA polymerase
MGDLSPDRAALVSLLDFYAESGVDCALDEAPHDRFADAARPRAAAPPRPAALQETARDFARGLAPAPRPASPQAVPSPDEAAADARSRARGARTLEELEALLAGFEGCALKKSAKNLCFFDGSPQARVMIVGEAPGADEDRTGKPFVGRAGQLLDRMLKAIGLDRGAVYIANVVPWRPPGNRDPTPQEVAACKPFLERQIELVDPDIVVCVGGASARALLGVKDGILKTRGRWFPYHTGTREIRALATLHPAYLLRSPLQKRLAWRDLRALRRALDGKDAA